VAITTFHLSDETKGMSLDPYIAYSIRGVRSLGLSAVLTSAKSSMLETSSVSLEILVCIQGQQF
jgi:hypothetical protein